MNKATIAIAVAAGLAGGMLTRFIAPPPVFAQTQALQTATDEVRARSFVLVDQLNKVVGTFTTDTPFQRGAGPIVLKDATGRVTWRAGGSELHLMGAN